MSHDLNNYNIHNLSMLALPKKQPKKNVTKFVKSSKISLRWLKMLERKMNCKIQMANNEFGLGEYSIMGHNKHNIYFDGYDEANRIVFEFHGCKYHECPKCFPNIDTGKYKKTIEREKYILGKGYRLFRIWEHEYKQYIDGKILEYGKFIT